jgi:uncharacterized protein (TIGR02246 family)
MWGVHADPTGISSLHDGYTDTMTTEHVKLAINGTDAADARTAARRLVAELQSGWDTHDADVTNRHFAGDIAWGSPFGATLRGYERLHAIHVRLKQEGRGGTASRFELVDVLAPAPGVALVQIKRSALDDEGAPVEPSDDTHGPFSEMALYVLVRRDDTWWVAAGQNTPIRPAPSG